MNDIKQNLQSIIDDIGDQRQIPLLDRNQAIQKLQKVRYNLLRLIEGPGVREAVFEKVKGNQFKLKD